MNNISMQAKRINMSKNMFGWWISVIVMVGNATSERKGNSQISNS